jgi:hypothetical protein
MCLTTRIIGRVGRTEFARVPLRSNLRVREMRMEKEEQQHWSYFFNPACQFSSTVIDGCTAASPAGMFNRNRWPSAEGV